MSVSGQVTHPGTFGLDAKYGRSLAYRSSYAEINKQIQTYSEYEVLF